MVRIAVLDDYQKVALKMADWQRLDAEVTVFQEPATDRSALVERLQPFDVVCLMRERTPFPATLIEALPNLRLIVTTGARNLSIDVVAAKAQGITVCGTESRKTTTSELAVLLILALTRRLIPEAWSLAAGGWQTGLGRDLNGLTLGLIGFGNIGQQMAALGKGFGMNAVAWSQNLTEERCAAAGVEKMPTLEALMAASDVVSVHLVHSQRTHRLVGRDAFAAMRPGAIFVNTSRAGIVDTDALLEGLRRGSPAKAGLDVFDEEPLPEEHPLRDVELRRQGKLLLTPHLGYVTEATWRVFYEQTVEAIDAWHAGTPIREIT